jgi:hypothetical protein
VPEPLGDNPERLAGGQRRCCIAVPAAVQGHRRQAGVADQAGEPLGDVLGVEDLAVLAGKDRAAVVKFHHPVSRHERDRLTERRSPASLGEAPAAIQEPHEECPHSYGHSETSTPPENAES